MIEMEKVYCNRAEFVLNQKNSDIEREVPWCFRTDICPCKKSQGQYDAAGKGYYYD